MPGAHDDNRREVAVWESPADLLALYSNKFNFQFAKSVLGKNGEITYNIVWQSKNLAPRFGISWEPIYALNWTLTLPTPGITVTLGGVWQTCALGQVYDLSEVGLWTPSGVTPRPNYMSVGLNKYKYPGRNGIHIVVGVKNSTGGYDVIYVDPTELGLNMSSWYQPQETVKWWYQTGVRTATMIAGADTPMETFDMSAPNPKTGLFYISTTYKYDDGVWANDPFAPPSVLETGLLGVPKRNTGDSDGNTTTGGGGGSHGQTGPIDKNIHNKIISIEKALLHLTVLLSTTGAHVNLAPYTGTINWPGLTSQHIMDAGGEAAANALRERGYVATAWTDLETSSSRVSFFVIGTPPQDGGVPMGVRFDWQEAFQAIPGNNGQRNGGVVDAGGRSRTAAAAAGQQLQQQLLLKGGEDGKENGVERNGGEVKNGGEETLPVRKAHARAVVAGAA